MYITMISWNGQPFIYDVFIRDGVMYLVSTYFTRADPAVRVYVNDVRAAEVGYNTYEPVRYFSCTAPTDTRVSIRIEATGSTTVEQTVDVERVVSAKRGLMAVATLFKEDYQRIPAFCEFYRAQGVEQFYLYYNGPALPEDIYKASDIEYRCWDFTYYNAAALPHINNQWSVGIWAHNAQMTFLTAMRLRYLPLYDWFGLVDLDELTLHPDNRLLTHLQSDIPTEIDCVIVRCHWGEMLDDASIRYTCVPLRSGRTKVFYRGRFTNLIGVHSPKHAGPVYISPVLRMVHYVDKYDPVSSNRTERLQGIVPPIAILRLPSAASQ